MDAPQQIPHDWVRFPHGKDGVGFVAANDKVVVKKTPKKLTRGALMAFNLPDHGEQLRFKDQVRTVTPHPEQWLEDANSTEVCRPDDTEEVQEHDYNADPIPPSVAIVSAWVPEEVVPSNNNGRKLTTSLEMNLQNEQSKRKWIFGIVLIASVLAIILAVLVICHDGQCFKGDETYIEPEGVLVQITISPGTQSASNLESLPSK